MAICGAGKVLRTGLVLSVLKPSPSKLLIWCVVTEGLLFSNATCLMVKYFFSHDIVSRFPSP